MKIANIMTADPVTISATAPLSEALSTLEELGIRHLPVVESETVVGVISDRDLLEATGWMWDEERGKAPVIIADLVKSSPVTVSPEDSVAELASQLIQGHFGCAPVVEGTRLVGIVTEIDVLTALTTGDTEAETESSAEGHTVGDRMSREVLTLGVDSTADDALEMLRGARVRHVPVLDDGKVRGMLSDRDLRRVVGRALPGSTSVREFMTSAVQTAAPTDALRSTARTMAQLKIGGLPVVEAGDLVGIITITDLLAYCALRT